MTGLWRGLTTNAVETDPLAGDPRLRGRSYAIPFDRVWTAALALAGGGLPRWRVLTADDQAGSIEAEATTRVFRIVDDVRIRVGLDENGQTRVDLGWSSRNGRAGLGRGHRIAGRFTAALDRALEARPAQILDATRRPTWST